MTSNAPSRIPAFRLAPGTGAPWLGRFLTRLAEQLRSGAAGDTLLVEQWWDGHRGEVRLLPYSEGLVLAMETLQAENPLRWTRRFPDSPCAPPTDLPETWFRLAPDPRAVPPAAPPAPDPAARPGATRPLVRLPPRDPTAGGTIPGALLPDGHRFWAAVQTHWTAGSDGTVWATTRGRCAAETASALRALESSVDLQVRRTEVSGTGPGLCLRRFHPSRRVRRAWASGARPLWGSSSAFPLTPERVVSSFPFPLATDPTDDPRLRQAVVLGASGSGKTAALAHLARHAVLEGRSVVLFDVHGDLAPRVASGLPPTTRSRVIGVDVTGRPHAIPGLSVFGPVPPADRDALVAHLVAALKRLSTENGETYWGFRLERLFETFLHIVQGQGGDLVDLWSLLTDPRRREAARLTTGRPEFVQFLEELDGIVRRQPEFLWPAASRVAKVVGSPLLTALLAPRERALDVGARLAAGTSTVWRLPVGELGPEGVTFAVTLLLTRIYLEQVRRAAADGPARNLRVLFVLDEAHLFPARLLSEIVSEGRKFGLGLVLATQYPARLAPELRDALLGAAGTVYLFRVPWGSAAATGAWAGLGPTVAEEILPALPPGWAVRAATGPGAERRLVAMPQGPSSQLSDWRSIVEFTNERYGSPVPYHDVVSARDVRLLEEDLLLGLVALEAEGGPSTRFRLFRWLAAAGEFDPVVALPTLETMMRRGWVLSQDDALMLSAAGADRVGLTARTGARPESADHRSLLVAALRIFARHHERLEILRQGRFDTRLPDGRVTVLPPDHRRWSPRTLVTFLDRRRTDWMWRLFQGRDVHVEAEVSGATRRERIERDWTKAKDAGAFLLCLVGDEARRRSVHRYLLRAGATRDRAMVWLLRSSGAIPARPSPS